MGGGRWDMSTDHEIEEGEALFGAGDDCVDPDELTYIDEKLQDVLGHFQKDFEGGMSAENLGPKFGGYGSFLPTEHRSPLHVSQSRSPNRPLNNNSASKSPFQLNVANSTTSRNHFAAVNKVKNGKVGVNGKFDTHQKVSEEATNNNDAKKNLKVRLKVGSDDPATRDKAAIYSGFGLDISPSSSEESPYCTPGRSPESVIMPSESPQTILKSMTLLILPTGGVISPLAGDILAVTRKTMSLLRRNQEIAVEGKPELFINMNSSTPVDIKARDSKPDERPVNNQAISWKTNDAVDIRDDNEAEPQQLSETALLSLASDLPGTKFDSTGNEDYDKVTGKLSTSFSGEENGFKKVRVKSRSSDYNEVADITETNLDGISGKCKPHPKTNKSERASKPQIASNKSLPDFDEAKMGTNSLSSEGATRSTDVLKGSVDEVPSTVQVSALQHSASKQKADKILQLEEQLFGEQRKKISNKAGTAEFGDISRDNLELKLAKSMKGKKKSSSSSKAGLTDKPHKDRSVKQSSHGPTAGSKETGGHFLDGALDFRNCSRLEDNNRKLVSSFPEAITSIVMPSDKPTSREYNYDAPEQGVIEAPVRSSTCNGHSIEANAASEAAVEINDNWACCDKCEQWRLLPLWIQPDFLPKKWRCSMQHWLSAELNSCKISEEESARAVHALYGATSHSNPSLQVIGSQAGYLAGTENKTNAPKYNTQSNLSVIGVPRLIDNQQTACMEGIADSNGYLDTGATDLSHKNFVQHGHKSSDIPMNGSSAAKEKRKKMLYQSDKESKKAKVSASECETAVDQHSSKVSHKIKKDELKSSLKLEKPNSSLGRISTSNSENDFPVNAPFQNGRAFSEATPSKDKCYKASHVSPFKTLDDEGHAHLNGGHKSKHPVSTTEISGQNISIKKRKVKQWELSQSNPDSLASNRVLKEDDLSPAKPIKIPKLEKEMLRLDSEKCNNVDTVHASNSLFKSKKHGTSRVDNDEFVSAGKEHLNELAKVNMQVQKQMDCRDTLKKDLSAVPSSAAATSSSSKVSGSLKTKPVFQEAKGSPVESVSSSPQKSSNAERRKSSLENEAGRPGSSSLERLKASVDQEAFAERKKERRSAGNGDLQSARSNKAGDSKMTTFGKDTQAFHLEVSGNGTKHKRDGHGGNLSRDSGDKADAGVDQNLPHQFNPETPIDVYTQDVEKWKPVKISVHAKENTVTDKDKVTASTACDKVVKPQFSKNVAENDDVAAKDSGKVLPKGKPNNSLLGAGTNDNQLSQGKENSSNKCGPSKSAASGGNQQGRTRRTVTNCDTSSSTNSAAAMKEARDLKHMANRMKQEGHILESTNLYFEAALKFLHVASLGEPLTFDISKQGEATQSMKLYSETAVLCDYCAREYERIKEMAAASLAYKCVEIAYLKASFYQLPSAAKDRAELQITFQMVPPGESPSSSASDLDNLNNQSSLVKAISGKANSPLIAGNIPVASRSNLQINRLLSYTNDLNCAFEATRKAHQTLAVAEGIMGTSQDDVISSVRKVIDFSYANVKELLQLVRLSLESIRCAKG